MTLPPAIRSEIEALLGPVRAASAVSGGSVSRAARLEAGSGPVFLKYDPAAPEGMFAHEAEGLAALSTAASGLRIPSVLGVSREWLLLEWLEPAHPGPRYDDRLGEGLAALHTPRGEGWGWEGDGFIGPLPQENVPTGDWPTFWRERRLEPQLRRARDAGALPGTAGEWDRLFARLPELLAPAEAEGPSLLHGDLWSGNVLSAHGEPALVDPAAYRGHREVDLAMTELFGGFGASFYAAYDAAFPRAAGYPVRRAVYQLFYLLVHVNLFGAAYLERTRSALREALSA